MKLLFYTMGNKDIGLGHFYRMQTLAQEAQERGHYVKFLSDYPADGVRWHKAQPDDPAIFYWAIRSIKPNWVIVDLPGKIPDWLFGHNRVCVIDQNDTRADLCVSQGYEGEYTAPYYLIIPPVNIPQRNGERCWFVWGGAADIMRLLSNFSRNVNEAALLVTTEMGSPPARPRVTHMVVKTINRHSFFNFALQCDRACVQMGQTVWELAHLGIPCYVFSATPEHLKTAMLMDRDGLVKAYPGIGIPAGDKFVKFISKKFTPKQGVIDGYGARRIVELLEERL